MQKRKSPIVLKLVLAAAAAMLVIIPTAAAWSAGPLGEIGGPLSSWAFWAFVVLVVGLASMVAITKPLVGRLPIGGAIFAKSGFALAVISAIALVGFNTGGFFHADSAMPSASIGGATDATFSASAFQPISDITFYAANAANHTAINPAIQVYGAGDATEKEAVEGTGDPLVTLSMTSGKVLYEGYQAQTYGCQVDVHMALSGYYERLAAGLDVCREKNANDNSAVSVPTLDMENIGTLSLATSDATLTVAEGSTASYSLLVRNTEDDSYLHDVAVKVHSTTNMTINSVTSGACELVEIQSTQYIKLKNSIGPLGTETCVLSVTYADGSTDGEMQLIGDDLFGRYGATAFVTNTQIESAAATATKTVTAA